MAIKAKTITTYPCPICGVEYETKEEAEKCYAKGFKPKFKVGDIVFATAGFGWYDGKKTWVSNPTVKFRGNPEHGNCFGACCTYQFYYVVTLIDKSEYSYDDSHRVRYHLYTMAMSGKQGHTEGWTFDDRHLTPVKTKKPPASVIKDSKKLIGKKASWLL